MTTNKRTVPPSEIAVCASSLPSRAAAHAAIDAFYDDVEAASGAVPIEAISRLFGALAGSGLSAALHEDALADAEKIASSRAGEANLARKQRYHLSLLVQLLYFAHPLTPGNFNWEVVAYDLRQMMLGVDGDAPLLLPVPSSGAHTEFKRHLRREFVQAVWALASERGQGVEKTLDEIGCSMPRSTWSDWNRLLTVYERKAAKAGPVRPVTEIHAIHRAACYQELP